MTVKDTIRWTTGRVRGRIARYVGYSNIFIPQSNWGFCRNVHNFNRLEGANDPTGR